MSAQLVADVEAFDAATLEFGHVLQGYSFNEGRRYAEFRSGDKLAGYGLTALVAGGAGAAAVKSGLLQRFWKLLVFGFVALVAGLKKILSAAVPYDVTADGQRFLLSLPLEAPVQSTPITVVTNWLSALRNSMSAGDRRA